LEIRKKITDMTLAPASSAITELALTVWDGTFPAATLDNDERGGQHGGGDQLKTDLRLPPADRFAAYQCQDQQREGKVRVCRSRAGRPHGHRGRAIHSSHRRAGGGHDPDRDIDQEDPPPS
jgi:hypothetical protein